MCFRHLERRRGTLCAVPEPQQPSYPAKGGPGRRLAERDLEMLRRQALVCRSRTGV